MSALFHPKITSYTLADGSYRTPDGKRVGAKTPGDVKVVTESSKWYARIRGKRVPLSESKDTARRMYRIQCGEAEVESILPHQARKTMAMRKHLDTPLTNHLEDYRRDLEALERTPEHVEKTIQRIKAILAGCAFDRWEDIDAVEVIRFLHEKRKADDRKKHRGFGIKTSNHYLTCIKSFTKWLAKRTPGDPLYTAEKLNADTDVRVERRALPPEEFTALRAAARRGKVLQGLTGPEREILYATAAYTGLRASELASLTPGSFNFTASPPSVTVEAACSKHRREDTIPLHPDLAAMLRDFIKGRDPEVAIWPGNQKAPTESWNKHGADIIRADLAEAGIEHIDAAGRVYDFHALRHQFVSNLALAGVHPKTAQELARHSDIRLTMQTYTHLGLRDQAAALDKLPALRPMFKKAAAGDR